MSNNKRPFYLSLWFIIPWIIVFFPIGFFLLFLRLKQKNSHTHRQSTQETFDIPQINNQQDTTPQIVEEITRRFNSIPNWNKWEDSKHQSSEQIFRMKRAVYGGTMQILNFNSQTGEAFVHGQSGQDYIINSASCSCEDYQKRQLPCKHMYFVAINAPLDAPPITSSFAEYNYTQSVQRSRKPPLNVTCMDYAILSNSNDQNLALYEVKGINPLTNRKNTVYVSAHSEADAIQQAIENKSGNLVEPFTVTFKESFSNAPTSRQLNYALDVLSYVPSDATSDDISCLLDRYSDDDFHLPALYLVEKGIELHIKISKYMGAYHLCRLIYNAGNLNDKIFAYVYAVMQSLEYEKLDEHTAFVCDAFVDGYSNNNEFINSFKRIDAEEFTPEFLSTTKKCYKIVKKFYKNF